MMRMSVTGAFSLDDVFEALESLRTKLSDEPRSAVLLDGRGVTGEILETDRFLLGAKIAELFGGQIKFVLLLEETYITKLDEITANNRGARLLVTHLEDEALDFLAPSLSV